MTRTLHSGPVDRTDARLAELERRFQSAGQDLKQGSDPLLDQLPRIDLVRVLTVGWLDPEHERMRGEFA